MALNAKVVSFLLSDGVVGTTQAITGVGFQPKAIIFFWGGSLSATDEQASANTRFGMGFAVSSTDRGYQSSFIEDGAATMNTAVVSGRDGCIGTSAAGAQDGRWDLVSMDTDGFTLIVDIDAPLASAVRVHALCIGGTDLTNAVGGQFNRTGATGNQSVTGVGFQPDIVFFFSTGQGGPYPDFDAAARWNFGAAISAAQQLTLWGFSEDATAASNTEKYMRFDECIFNEINAGFAHQRATFVSQDVDGFTINWLTGTNTHPHMYLALKGGEWLIGNDATETSLITIPTTGYGFAPVGVMVLSHNATAQSAADTPTAGMSISVGAADSPISRGSHLSDDGDGNATSDVEFGIQYDEIYQNITTGGGISGLMDVQSFDSDGVTFVMDDADPAAQVFGYIAMGMLIVAFSSAVAITGDGALAATTTTQRFGSVTVSADGAVARATQKNGIVAASVAGDGALSATAAKDGEQASSVSGDGAVAAIGQKSGQATIFVDGDGNIVAVGFKSAFTAVSASDDGQINTEFAVMGSTIARVEGDGTISVTFSGQHFAASSVSGDGAATVTATKNSSDQVAVSDDGAVVVTSHKGGQSATTLSGDGAVDVAAFAGVAITGGGAIAAVGTKQAFSATLVVSGGGMEVVGEEGAFVAAELSGDGNVTVATAKTAQGSVTISGDGALEVAATTQRFSSVTVDGDGLQPVVDLRTLDFTKQAFLLLEGPDIPVLITRVGTDDDLWVIKLG